MVASGHSPAGFVFLFFRFGRLAEGTGPILEEKKDNFFAAATRGVHRGAPAYRPGAMFTTLVPRSNTPSGGREEVVFFSF